VVFLADKLLSLLLSLHYQVL